MSSSTPIFTAPFWATAETLNRTHANAAAAAACTYRIISSRTWFFCQILAQARVAWFNCRTIGGGTNGIHIVGDLVPGRQLDHELPGRFRLSAGLRDRPVRVAQRCAPAGRLRRYGAHAGRPAGGHRGGQKRRLTRARPVGCLRQSALRRSEAL